MLARPHRNHAWSGAWLSGDAIANPVVSLSVQRPSVMCSTCTTESPSNSENCRRVFSVSFHNVLFACSRIALAWPVRGVSADSRVDYITHKVVLLQHGVGRPLPCRHDPSIGLSHELSQ